MTILLTTLVRPVEGSTILLARVACGDGTTLDLGDRLLDQGRQAALAERHPNQVASMMEASADAEGA